MALVTRRFTARAVEAAVGCADTAAAFEFTLQCSSGPMQAHRGVVGRDAERLRHLLQRELSREQGIQSDLGRLSFDKLDVIRVWTKQGATFRSRQSHPDRIQSTPVRAPPSIGGKVRRLAASARSGLLLLCRSPRFSRPNRASAPETAAVAARAGLDGGARCAPVRRPRSLRRSASVRRNSSTRGDRCRRRADTA